MKKITVKSQVIVGLVCAFIVLIACFSVISLFTATTTFSNIEEVWDGVEVATSFSGGNGTKDNPYQIKNGSELAYLKELVNEKQVSNLKDLYFVLSNNIDLGGHTWQGIGTGDSPFSGYFDGCGYIIQNFSIDSPTIIDNVSYYSFFNLVSDGVIQNINFNNVNLVTEASLEPIVLGLFAGKMSGVNVINNIAIYNTTMDLTKTLVNNESQIGGVAAIVSKDTNFENVYIQMEINDSNANSYGNVFGSFYGTANNIVTQVTYTNFLSANISDTFVLGEKAKIENCYRLVASNNRLSVSSPENIDVSILTEELNQHIQNDYLWIEENSLLKIVQNKVLSIDPVQEAPMLFNFGRSASIVLHDTGVTDTTVYINDLDSDYNYYQGLNYTESSTGNLPSSQNQGLYTDNNLVKVYIKYSGVDVNDDTLVGHVSLNEEQSEFIYYKYYPVENGYVTIELIDNPFADHPNDKGFNGWVTDYPNAEILYDDEIYTRYVKIPVTYTNGIPDIINITFYSNWLDANVSAITRNNSWSDAFSNLKMESMQLAKGYRREYEDMSQYYVMGQVGWFSSYPSNAYDVNLNRLSSICFRPGGCTYYTPSSSEYNPNQTYYRYNGSRLVSYTPQIIEESADMLKVGSLASGFYTSVSIPMGQSIAGYYDDSGNYQESGTCSSSSCTYYELQQYYNSDGSVNVVNDSDNYYYLVTRDMNVIILQTDVDVEWDSDKPFTLTGIWNDVDYSDNVFDIQYNSLIATADTRIEYITINSAQEKINDSAPSSSSNYRRIIYGGWNNFKIGRGIKTTYGNDYVVANAVLGGNNGNVGSSGNIHRYKMVVESGIYNTMSATNGTSNRDMYIDGYVVYGSDYDRVSNDNSSLNIYFCASGSWGGSVYSFSTSSVAIHTNIKSGSFGSSKYDYSTGVYVGGRQGGTHYAARDAIVEGGYIYNLIGGPLTADNRTDINDTFINIKGGTIDIVVGGAGASETYGNRIINMTDGVVNYGVFGGSNGYTGDDSGSYKGTLSGNTFVYIGGNAVVGNDQLIQNESSVFGVSSGNVFGIGNGNSDSTQVGSANSSNVIIDGNALIKSNVYGGGNYGATGLVPYQDQNGSKYSTTNIKILGGTIEGAVYGGGNNNGSGGEATYTTSGWLGGGTAYSTTVTSTINIEMYGGTVGSLYGGSRVKGTVYGDVNVSILNGTILQDVYGGGEGGYQSRNNFGTYVEDNVNVMIGNTVAGPVIYGNVYGGSAYGTVNGTGENESANSKTTIVTVNNGVITNSVFGGGKGNNQYSPKVYGNVTVNINNGNIGKVFGGNDAAGSPSNNDIVYLNGGIIGDAFGGGNQTGQTVTNIYLQGATVNKLFGGSNESGHVTTTNVYVTNGTSGYIYGGNNLGGDTITDNVRITGGTITEDVYGGGSQANADNTILYLGTAIINNVYGGSERASVTTTNSQIEGATIENFYGGSNISGTVNNATVTMVNGTVGTLYGGNNAGGTTNVIEIIVDNGTITAIYGGGNQAASSTSSIKINNGIINNVYGGGNQAGLDTTEINILEGDIGNVYGGSNLAGDITKSSIKVGENSVDINLDITATVAESWQSTTYSTYATVDVTLKNNTTTAIDNWELQLEIPQSTIYSNYSNTEIVENNNVYTMNAVNPYYGVNTLDANGGEYTFSFNILSNQKQDSFQVIPTLLNPNLSLSSVTIDNIFGGNNKGGSTSNSSIDVNGGVIGNIYGGGDEAFVDSPNVKVQNATVDNIYGGGNMAGINGDTKVTVTNSNINTNIYGGGNYGSISGSTEVLVTSSTILGSAYAGGNGSTAIVNKNTTITVEGNTVIGTSSSKAPEAGCLFGGGNAAATGTKAENNSLATVNIVGATIYGNVYGGANTSVVYGKTDTNIGTNAVVLDGLDEDNINIVGTVFGGGEANASGDENYDYSFISVTGAIDIQIDGKGYLDHAHQFLITGSIFGSGNASSSSGISNITIANLGTRDNPSKNISIQRANLVVLDNTTMELKGTTDRTNEYSDIKYSLNRIDELNIKNNTMLLLQQNANLLKSFKSTVDLNGKEEKASVIIDDDTKTVSKNVDNRLYMLANKNLNVTTNEAATSYGEVSGMTFFGMYNGYANGSFSYGLYDDSFQYGDNGDAGDIIIGGSYVLGLHSLNHDITVDGFYSNFMDDAYTEVSTAYINPTPPDSNYYMWTIGISAVNYSFSMTASKYSSLGTYELPMREFSNGDTTFEVIGFNSEGLTSGVELIDSNEVPKVADTEEEANKVLGLSMKSETSEWTSYGVTKFLSPNGGSYIGDKTYKTDSQALAPSLMFYLYHAKNITLNQELGTVVITMQAKTPKNEIEFDVQLITITIDLTARDYDDGNSYDASITYDKKYEMPAATTVNITNRSQFTAYFDLYAESSSFEEFYGRENTNYHALVTDYALPVGTQITMLDFGSQSGTPEYYYYTVDDNSYQRALQQLQLENEICYHLSDFIKMGSTSENNTYDDKTANQTYYDEEKQRTIEEFIFIFDFKETSITGDYLNKYIRFELRNEEDRALVTVLGIRHTLMYFNLYESSNLVLNQNVSLDNNYIYPNMQRNISYETMITYDQTANRESIINTNYESTSMGLNIVLYDQSGNQVSSSLLTGTSIRMDGVEYFADSEGVFRIKLAGKVSNLKKSLYLLTDENLPAGNYEAVFTLFASSDGLHNSGNLQYTEDKIHITVVPADNAITVTSKDVMKIIDGETGLNEESSKQSNYRIVAVQSLENPNVRVSLYKRNITDQYDKSFSEINMNEVFSNTFDLPSFYGLTTSSLYEVMVSNYINSQVDFKVDYNDSLTSGTYKIVFRLYDDNQLIDEDFEYFIIKKSD